MVRVTARELGVHSGHQRIPAAVAKPAIPATPKPTIAVVLAVSASCRLDARCWHTDVDSLVAGEQD